VATLPALGHIQPVRRRMDRQMITFTTLFASILLIASTIGIIGGILGLFSCIYIWKKSTFIEFLVHVFEKNEKKDD
jgi:hypothetical protein